MRQSLSVSVLLLAFAVLPAVAGENAAGTTGGKMSRHGGVDELLAAMDREADPCVDFYQYACGGWLAETELPSDQARWTRSFSVIRERNREIVRDMLEAAAENPGPEGTERWMTGTYYGSCMDVETVEKGGSEPLNRYLEDIAKVDNPATALKLAGEIQRLGANVLIGLGVIPDFKDPGTDIAFFSQGGLGMPDRDYYVSDDEKKKELLGEYEMHVARMLGYLGQSEEEAAANAARILAFETRLAEASRPRQEMRIPEKLYNKLDITGLQELTPELDWKGFLAGTGHPGVTQINVAVPEFYEALQITLGEADAATLQAYLTWNVVNQAADWLPQRFVDANFEFYGQKLSGQAEIRPRWKRCVDSTENALGEALGKLYVEEHFAGDSKQKALEMIHDIEAAFDASLPTLAWMDDPTRERAKEKVVALKNKIGYPEEWRDYSTMTLVPGNYFTNAVVATEFEFDRQARKIGQPVDPKEWLMTPQMVNAYYHPLKNEIAFPAGILQPPFFHKDFPAAMNYGAIGTVVGHELTHGFDDQGRKFAPDGQLREWWEPAVAEKFEERAQCVRDYYSEYEVEEGVNVNGTLTAGENIADIGGLKQTYMAYQEWEKRHGVSEPVVEGLTNDQLLFVAFAQVWCTVQTPERLRLQVTTDPHSPAQFRAEGPTSSNPFFAETFGCEAGQPMVPNNRCEVW